MVESVISLIIILILIIGLVISLDVLLKWKDIDFELLNVQAFLEENVLKRLWIKMFIGLSLFFVGYLIDLFINHMGFFNIEIGGLRIFTLILQAIGAFWLVKVLYDWSLIYKNAIEK